MPPSGADAVLRIGSAQAALWWRQAPPLAGHRPGLIGRFSADRQGDAVELLGEAGRLLREAGCTLALGPMDGSIWDAYRFVTWRGSEPRFVLEPDQPGLWPIWWQHAGFSPREHYWSAIYHQLDRYDLRLDAVAAALGERGVTVRPLRPADLPAELARLHAVTDAAFRHQVLYTPLPLARFQARFLPLAPLLEPPLSFIAEQDGAPVGFILAVADAEQARRGAAIDTLVVKTLAVRPGRQHAGLGKLLLERSQQAAHARGFSRVILALMHRSSRSGNLRRDARELRRYTLFGKPLP